jgi:hypothetical protein
VLERRRRIHWIQKREHAGAAAAARAAAAWVLVRNLTCFSLKIFVSFCSWFWFGVIRFTFYYVWIFFLNLG